MNKLKKFLVTVLMLLILKDLIIDSNVFAGSNVSIINMTELALSQESEKIPIARIEEENIICNNLKFVRDSDDFTVSVKCLINKEVEEVKIPSKINCEGIEYIVTNIKDCVFFNCIKLKSIVIPEGIKEIGNYVFFNCKDLTAIWIPTSVTKIGVSAFSDCKRLTSITIPKNVIEIREYAFENCKNLMSIIVSEENKIYSSKDGVLFNKEKNFLKCYPQGKVDNVYEISKEITGIEEGAFKGCSNLKVIKIFGNIKKIEYVAFKGCTELVSIIIPESVTEIEDLAFYGCLKLNSIIIPKNTTRIGTRAFFGCKELSSVVMSDNVKEIEREAFCNCKKLKSIVIPEGVTKISEYTFCSCSELTSIILPTSITKIEEGAFKYCVGINSITIPENVTKIGYGVFIGCARLISITIPKNVTQIEENVFVGCMGLERIKIDRSDDLGKDYAKKFYKINAKVRICMLRQNYDDLKLVNTMNLLFLNLLKTLDPSVVPLNFINHLKLTFEYEEIIFDGEGNIVDY